MDGNIILCPGATGKYHAKYMLGALVCASAPVQWVWSLNVVWTALGVGQMFGTLVVLFWSIPAHERTNFIFYYTYCM